MRYQLKNINGQRMPFIATVERFGTKKNLYTRLPDKTILLKDVKFAETGKPATTHIWFTVGKTIDALNLSEGDIIKFEARVAEYVKGFVNYREYIDERTLDYKLNRPTKFEKLN